MKTLIELYVNEQYDNLLAAMVFKPERLIFVCTDHSPDKQTRQSILAFLNSVRQDMKVEFSHFGNRSVSVLFDRLDEICAEHEDCVIDMTGGSTAALIAAESYCAKRGKKAFYFDYAANKFASIRGMGETIAQTPMPNIDIPTLISVGGACITGTCHSTKQLKANVDIVRRLLLIYSKNLREWNSNSEYLQYCCKYYYDGAAQVFNAQSIIRNNNSIYIANRRLLREFEAAGAISELSFDDDSVFFRFKSPFIKELLTTVGMCLELLIYQSAVDCESFDDVMMSVVFDWDGILHASSQDTVNELDVVMTRGFSPVFVSCKSAKPDTRDLYEIWYLARRFGGKRARPVLATAVPLSTDSWATYVRARDMGIIVIEMRDIEAYNGGDWLHDLILCPSWLEERPR